MKNIFIFRLICSKFTKNDLRSLLYSSSYKVCTLCFTFRRILLFAFCQNTAACCTTVFLEEIVDFVRKLETAVNLRITRCLTSEEISDTHRCSGECTTDTSASAKPPWESGTHSNRIIRHVQFKILLDRINDRF